MNKKFLSAILFGALMVTSTGTFVSCKDYDDDIENLQGQISANASAIAELKTLIQNSDYVTNVAVSGQNLVVTFKNAGSQTLALPVCEDEVGSICDVVDGVLYIDGKATDIKVCEPTEENEFKPAIDIVDGEWAVLQEDGTYKSTGVAVSSVAVTGNEKEGWILTIKDAEGNAETVKLPSAAALLTNASLGTYKTIELAKYTPWVYSGALGTDASTWKGTKTLPNKNDVVVANVYADPTTSPNGPVYQPIDLRIDPVNVDGTAFEYTLINAKNETLSKVTLRGVEYKDYEPKGRAAYGNGLYSLVIDNFIVVKDDVDGFTENYIAHVGKKHAVNINNVYRTEYAAEIKPFGTAKQLGSAWIGGTNIDNANVTGINVGQEYKVTFDNQPALYDMFFYVDAEYVNEFGITWDNATHKFKVGKNPDASTVDAHFPLTVYSLDNNGTVVKHTTVIYLSAKLGNITMYDTYTHDVSSTYNQFDIELATMRTALGTELDKWMINVASVEAKLYGEIENGDVKGDAIQTIAASNNTDNDNLFERLFINSAKNASVAIKNAAYLRMYVDNDLAATAVATTNGTEPIKLDKTYYIKVTFSSSTGTNAGELNSMIVPVKFVAPTVAEQIEVKDGYVKDGAINAYFYKTTGQLADKKTVDVNKYFTYAEQIEDAEIKFSDAKVVTYNWADYGTDDLVALSSGTTLDNAVLKLSGSVKADLGTEVGYGQTLNLSVEKSNYEGWKYTVDGDNKYAFSMRIMSPIMEGSIVPVEGNTIKISANDLVNGAKITDKMIMGYDYNGNAFDIVPDAISNSTTPNGSWWEDPQIVMVTPDVDKKAYLKSATLAAATEDADGNVVKGAIVVKGESLSQTTEVLMPVTVKDCWAYLMTKEVSVTVEVK